jgi:hypothetical protein
MSKVLQYLSYRLQDRLLATEEDSDIEETIQTTQRAVDMAV